MKRGIMGIAVILMITLTSCKSVVQHDVYSKIYEQYNAMQSYIATAAVTVANNKGESVYRIRQYYSAPDRYRMDILDSEGNAETTYLFNGGTITLHSRSGGDVTLDDSLVTEKDYVFLPDFFADYFRSQDSFVSAARDLNGAQTELGTMCAAADPSRFRQSLWIDDKTLVPSRLITYDADGNEVLCVSYENFSLNERMDDAVFQL